MNGAPLAIAARGERPGYRLAGRSPFSTRWARELGATRGHPAVRAVARLSHVPGGERRARFRRRRRANSHDWDIAAADLVLEEAGAAAGRGVGRAAAIQSAAQSAAARSRAPDRAGAALARSLPRRGRRVRAAETRFTRRGLRFGPREGKAARRSPRASISRTTTMTAPNRKRRTKTSRSSCTSCSAAN